MYILDGPNDFEKDIYLKNILEKQKLVGNIYSKKYNLNELENLNNLKYEILNKSFFSTKVIFILIIDNFNEVINDFFNDLIKIDDLPNEVIIKINNITKLKTKNMLVDQKNYINFKTLNNYQLMIWANKYLKDQKLKIDRDAIKLLVNFVIENQYDLYHEVNKLKNFNQEINVEIIKKLSFIKENFSVFDLIDNVFNNKLKNSIRIFKSIVDQKISLAELIAVFGWYLTVLQLIKNSDNLSVVADQTKINLNTLNHNKTVADNFSKAALRNIINDLIEIDKLSKQIKIDGMQALEVLFLRISFFY